MKLKKRYCLILLLICGCIYSQKKVIAVEHKDSIERTIHSIIIFKWCKEDNNHNIKRYIKIDSLGNVIIKNQNFLEKVAMKPFTKRIFNFIKNENLKKIPGDNGEPQYAELPKPNQQNIYISIILTEDYVKEKKLRNNSYYSWSKLDLDKLQNDYVLFKYLDKRDTDMLKRYLE